MQTTASSDKAMGEIRRKLATLRSALRKRLAGEGLAWWVIAAIAALFATLGADYALHMERPLRVAMMLAAVAALGWLAWRHLAAPLLARMDADELALLVERRHVDLEDRLVSALQLSRPGAAGSQSASMVHQVVLEARQRLGELDLDAVVERRRMKQVAMTAACTLALLAGFAFWKGPLLALYVQRNMAFADVDWPQETYLRVEGGPDFTLVRGDDLRIVIRADRGKVAPPTVILHAHYSESASRTEEQIDPVESGGNRYVKVFRGVGEEFSFHVTGGDDRQDRRRPHRVRLIDPPVLSRVRFLVTSPAYMRRGVRRVDGSSGILQVPNAGSVQVYAEATKDLRSAEILLDGRPVGAASVEPLDGPRPNAGRPRRIVGQFQVTAPSPRPGKAAAHVLRFALTDTDGYSSRRGQKYSVEILKDRPPSVDLRKRIVRAVVTPKAVVPLRIVSEDDCGIATIRTLLSAKTGKHKNVPGPVRLPDGLQKKLTLDHELDLLPLGLAAGDIVEIHAEVIDTLPASLGGPNIRRCGALSLRLVRPDELMSELIRRQKAIRLEFVQAIALQQSAGGKTQAAAGELAKSNISAEMRRNLAESAGAQTSVGAECAKSAAALAAIQREMAANRLGSQEQRGRIGDQLVEPLRALAEQIGRVVAVLRRTTSISRLDALRSDVDSVVQSQEEILRGMRRILESMQKLESRQDMINKLRMILGWSEEQLKKIEQARDAELENIFEDATRNKNQP